MCLVKNHLKSPIETIGKKTMLLHIYCLPYRDIHILPYAYMLCYWLNNLTSKIVGECTVICICYITVQETKILL